MQRREFLKLSGGATLAAATAHVHNEALASLADIQPGEGLSFYVSSSGNDNNPGTSQLPFATFHRAQQAVRQSKRASIPITVLVRGGTYYLKSPLTFGPEDSGSAEAPLIYAGQAGEAVTLSGGLKLTCAWSPYKNGIMMASVPPGLEFTQLFINGKRQIRARYPNYDPSNPGKSGYIQAAGSIPTGTANPYARPDDEMTFSTQAPRGIRFDPATFTKESGCFYCIGGEFEAVVDQLRSEGGKRNPKRYNLEEWQKLGFDEHSVFADPLFVDPSNQDFRVHPESPALRLGFKNFEMGKWGLTDRFPKQWRESKSQAQ